MSDVERARYDLIRDQAPEFVERCCCGKRADPEGIEEVCDESDSAMEQRWRPALRGAFSDCGQPDEGVDDSKEAESQKEVGLDTQHAKNSRSAGEPSAGVQIPAATVIQLMGTDTASLGTQSASAPSPNTCG